MGCPRTPRNSSSCAATPGPLVPAGAQDVVELGGDGVRDEAPDQPAEPLGQRIGAEQLESRTGVTAVGSIRLAFRSCFLPPFAIAVSLLGRARATGLVQVPGRIRLFPSHPKRGRHPLACAPLFHSSEAASLQTPKLEGEDALRGLSRGAPCLHSDRKLPATAPVRRSTSKNH